MQIGAPRGINRLAFKRIKSRKLVQRTLEHGRKAGGCIHRKRIPSNICRTMQNAHLYVGVLLQLGHKRRRKLRDIVPCHIMKDAVGLNVSGAPAAKSVLFGTDEDTYERSQFVRARHIFAHGEIVFVVRNTLVHIGSLRSPEGQCAKQHFIQHDSQAPPVHSRAIATGYQGVWLPFFGSTGRRGAVVCG